MSDNLRRCGQIEVERTHISLSEIRKALRVVFFQGLKCSTRLHPPVEDNFGLIDKRWFGVD